VHPDKTRLIEFGRYAEQERRGRGEGKPATFDFLGFTPASRTSAGSRGRGTSCFSDTPRRNECEPSCGRFERTSCGVGTCPCPSKGGGSRRWSADTSRTTPYPRTCIVSTASEPRSFEPGSTRFGAEASATA
jgi:hypothetical protein